MGKACSFHEKFNFLDNFEFQSLIKHFSENGDDSLNFQNIKHLFADLVTNSQGKSYELSELLFNKLFTVFDRNGDRIIDSIEFGNVYKDFIKPLVKPVTALLVIDVQNDFVDGSLALKNCPAKQDGKDVIPVVNSLLENYKFDVVVYSLDFHPQDHISFFENVNLYNLVDNNKPLKDLALFDTVTFEGPPKMTQKLWPQHCIQNTWGSELPKGLKVAKDSLSVFKGTNTKIDSYSAFFDNMKLLSTKLNKELRSRNVTHVLICGLAFDYCVGFTAIDAVELGYATVIIQDATRGTDDNNIKSMKEKLKSANCVIASSGEIENLISGKDIRPEFASALLETIK